METKTYTQQLITTRLAVVLNLMASVFGLAEVIVSIYSGHTARIALSAIGFTGFLTGTNVLVSKLLQLQKQSGSIPAQLQ